MKIHFCQSVDGAIKNWSTSQWADIAEANNITISAAKDAFIQYVREGKRVIPLGEPCEGFSYENGCQGHEDIKENE